MNRLVGPEWTQSSQKRDLDMLGVGLLAPALATVGLAEYLAVRHIDDADPIFSQTRYGLAFEPFTIYKFRTMPANTPETPSATNPRDDRATPLGNRLRQSYIDEVPQAVNVVRGNMSLIGPRPLIKQDVADTLDVLSPNEQKQWIGSRSTAKPGITNPYSLTADVTEERSQTIYNRALGDIEYAAQASLSYDLGLCIASGKLTMGRLLHGEQTTRGYRKGAKLLETSARGMGVRVTEDETLIWRVMFGAARALDDVVDDQQATSVVAEVAGLVAGTPIGAMSMGQAVEFQQVFAGLSPARQQIVMATFLSLPDFSAAKRAASSVDELIAVNEAEARGFAQILELEVTDQEYAERTRFNGWLQAFASVGYMVDTATDMGADAKAGLISIEPGLLSRAKVLARSFPEMRQVLALTPPRVLARLAGIALHNTVQSR